MKEQKFLLQIKAIEPKKLTLPANATTARDTSTVLPHGSFLQSTEWAEFKSGHGWKPLFLCVTGSYRLSKDATTLEESPHTTKFEFTCSVLVRRFARFFSIAYIPMGPYIPFFTKATENSCLKDYLQLITQFSQTIQIFLPKKTLCVRMDVPIDFLTIEERDNFIQKTVKNQSKLHKSSVDIQPPDTTTLDLSKSDNEILAAMKQKWRYNIRLAEKKDVTINSVGITGIDSFYSLYEETAKRDGISIHHKAYYKNLIKLGANSHDFKVSLYIATHEEDTIAAIITVFTAQEAVYLYGASSNTKRNLMATYLLQWTAIKDAKIYGSQIYDFYGMPPTDNVGHPMHGLYRFKTGFGGKNIHRPGSIDVMLSPMYIPYIFAEKLRVFYYKRIKKLLVGR